MGLERSGQPVGAVDRAMAIGGNLRGWAMAMPAGQRRWMGASVLMIGAVMAGMLWYTGRPDWRTLYSGLDGKDSQQIAQELSAAGISYQLTGDGDGIEVGADQLDKARMEVAAKGMPQSGRMGFELFDKPNWVGSEFDEKVNYQRAMEGELERTIGTLGAVKSARVHLVMPKDSMFSEAKEAAKASVVLKLRRSTMPPEQVESIRNLVAGAVEGLTAENVALVDADGRVDLGAPSNDAAAGTLERDMEGKLVAMLAPTAGEDNVRATVTVSYDESSQDKTDDIYDPTQTATLTMQKSEQTTAPPGRAAGVPGTASNTPGVAAPGSVQAAAKTVTAGAGAAAAAVPPLMQQGAAGASGVTGSLQKDASLPVYPWQGGGQMQTATQENGTYGVTRHVVHEEQGPGRIRRVTAAVVVNDRMTSEGSGKDEHAVWKPRSPEEMKQLEQLARAAIGFDATRGDEVVIENVGFSSNVPEVKPPVVERLLDESSTMLHGQQGLLKTLSFAGLSLLLVMVVLRPLTKQMMASMSQAHAPLLLAPGQAGSEQMASGAAAGRFQGGAQGSMSAGIRPQQDNIADHVSEHIRREPAQSTRLLTTWIGESTGERN